MKTENLKVAIFPIGSTVRFQTSTVKRPDGTSEYYKLIWSLVRNLAISEVWLLQVSDWKKLSDEEKREFDPRGVLRDIRSEYNVNTSGGKYKNLWEAIKDLGQPDFGIGSVTQGMTLVNIPGIIPGIKNPDKMREVLAMSLNYSAPVIHYVNMSKIPWLLIITDPRYVGKNQSWRDIVHAPLECVTQYNMDINFKHYDTYPEPAKGKEIVETLKLSYSGIEKMNVINEEIVHPESERDIKFAIAAMQSSYGNPKGDYRFEAIKKWILDLDNTENYHIYGKWDESIYDKYPQFQGFVSYQEVDEIFKRTRYTLIVPIRPDWVTSKYTEMIRVGVVPFFHIDYDTQFSTLPKDHYLRVKTPQEMFDKIEEMEKCPSIRIKLVKELQETFLQDVKDGSVIANIFNPYLERANVNIRLSKQSYVETNQIKPKTNNKQFNLF
jgi:hypothetical protein